MFNDVSQVLNWLFKEVSVLADFIWTNGKWVGICVIGLPLIRRVINIFRKLLY